MSFQHPRQQSPFSVGSNVSPSPSPAPAAPAPRRGGGGGAWALTFVIPLVLVLGGYGLLYVFFGVDGEEDAGGTVDAAAVSTTTVTQAPQTTPSAASDAAPSPTSAAPSPEAEDPTPTALATPTTPAAPAAQQITPGNYELELAGGDPVRCQMYDPDLGMFLACQAGNVNWTNDTGRSANSVSIQFNPARAQGVIGDLGNITMEGTLSTGGVYEMSTPDGTVRIDITDPERIVFTRDGEEAWIARSGFGPVASPLDQLR